ncbi:MAG: N-acetyl-gamma-glutamyl-phosphate reductase [Blastocatellia bacterium]|nr:N-acetyl-gamma-glutamyl-phosphate reductase [Blastocatellia bacterium]
MMLRVSIVGASGYVGGELIRLLLGHPQVRLHQITSERLAGQYLHSAHPNLRGATDLRFTSVQVLESCDVLILALPHGQAAQKIETFAQIAPHLIDASADFRLADTAVYERWYGAPHPCPEWLTRFAYGLPEVNRERIREGRYVSGVGCNATAVNLALLPLVQAGLVDTHRDIVAEVKVGSSEGGNEATEASHHPERSGVVRSFAPTGHRHTAEVNAVLGLENIHLSITSVELVRGALATCHAFVREPVTDREIWRAFRATYGNEPFVRIVHEKRGMYRHPEPKILAGSNFADVGWSLDEQTGRIVTLCAIDNLMKGAAGSAVQCLNLMCGFEERTGLGFTGLHPI